MATSAKKIEANRRNLALAEQAKATRRVTNACLNCGDPVTVPPSVAARGKGKYCDWDCRTNHMRGDNGPNAGGGDWMRGKENPNWNGGSATERHKVYRENQAELNQWRRRVYARDDYTCQRCGLKPNKRGQLNAHHIATWSECEDLRFEVNNGITLCLACHQWVHSDDNTEKHFLWEAYRADVVTGGVPCQPASTAGKRRGKEDDRWLWPEAIRVIREIRPRWVILENVHGLTSLNEGMELATILADLEAIGYASQCFVIPACAVDARHRRDRVWIVANAESNIRRAHARSMGRGEGEGRGKAQGGPLRQGLRNPEHDGLAEAGEDVADASGTGRTQLHRQQSGGTERGGSSGRCGALVGNGSDVADDWDIADAAYYHTDANPDRQRGRGGNACGQDAEATGESSGHSRRNAGGMEGRKPKPRMGGLADGLPAGLAGLGWLAEPGIGRVAAGIPERVAKLKALGNAVVPQVVEVIGRAIMECES